MDTENKTLFTILLDLLGDVEQTTDPAAKEKAQQAHVLGSSLFERLNQPQSNNEDL